VVLQCGALFGGGIVLDSSSDSGDLSWNEMSEGLIFRELSAGERGDKMRFLVEPTEGLLLVQGTLQECGMSKYRNCEGVQGQQYSEMDSRAGLEEWRGE